MITVNDEVWKIHEFLDEYARSNGRRKTNWYRLNHEIRTLEYPRVFEIKGKKFRIEIYEPTELEKLIDAKIKELDRREVYSMEDEEELNELMRRYLREG